MKGIFILFSLFIINFSLSAQWEVIHQGPAVKDIYFTSDKTGWMAGSKMLLKTSDGGDSWQTLNLNDDLYFENIRFFNDSLGLAVACIQEDFGNWPLDYLIFRSEDGGQSWQEIASPPGENDAVEFVTDSIFFDVNNDTLFRTKDAGQSWHPMDYRAVDRPVFINSCIGFLRAYNSEEDKDILLRSIDSGESWQEMPAAPNDFDRRDLHFVNDSTGYLVYHDDELSLNHLFFTTDTGSHWTTRYSTAYREGIQTFVTLSEDTLYAVFTGYEDTINWVWQTQLKTSTDGGLSWNVIQELEPNWWNRAIAFDSRGKGYLLATVPGGFPYYDCAMVLKQSGEGPWQLLFSAYPFNALCMVSEEKGFAVGGVQYDAHGSLGNIFRTTDGGKSWELSFSDYRTVEDLVFADEFNGFALGIRRGREANASVLKTDNGGNSWYLLNNVSENYSDDDIRLELEVFCFIDNNQGWLAGAYVDYTDDDPLPEAIILNTTDGGQTWDTQWKYNTDDYENSIYDLEVVHSVLWAVGENGLMVKSVDSSSFTVLERQTNLPLNKIFFTDRQHGWIAGGFYDWDSDRPQSVLLRTKDGGQNWQEYTGTEFIINDLFFADSLQGWAAGSDSSGKGIILETVDGGENWLTRVEGLRGELMDFYYKDSTLWAVGEHGMILKKEGVIWTDINSGVKYPLGIQLSQNYPNPFSSKTIIEYRIPDVSHVELSVYNTKGQKVATLVNKNQQAGSYKVEWNASVIKPGIYICEMKAGKSRKVMDMVLLKE